MPSPADKPMRRDAVAPPHLYAAARAALAEASAELGPLLRQELERLAQARVEWRGGAGAQSLRLAAHDLRGLGGLYGAPLAGRMATSLERLLALGDPPAGLVDAHVDAVAAVVREGAADGRDGRGATLAQALEAAVQRLAQRAADQAA